MLKKTVSGIMLIILLMGTLYIMLDLKPVAGWSNGGYSSDPNNPNYGTHDWIAQHALDWLPNKEKEYIINNLAIYLYGTELPDNSGAPDGIGDTALHHIYYWSNESLQDDASAVRAQTEYNNALNYIKSGNVTMGVKTLGITSHYIVDVTVFGHVMGSGTDWGSEVHHSDYESYVQERTNSYDDEFNTYLAFDGGLDVISAYDAACTLAYDTTFDADGDLTCVWMDQNYDWNNQTFKDRCGESLNLAVNILADVLHTFYTEAFGVSGKVTEVDGVTPIAGAMVEALQQGDLVVSNTTTDAKGEYFLALSAGVYKMCAKAENHITAIKPVVNTTESGVAVNFNLTRGQMLVFDEFTGTSLNTSKWNSHVTGIGYISIANATGWEPTNCSYVGAASGGPGSAAITSKLTATLDSTIIFEGRIAAYVEGSIGQIVYGDRQPRGLRAGTDENNAIEFRSASSSIEARTVASGIATTTNYYVGIIINNWNWVYRIEANSSMVKFYVNGILIATHTTNIPTTPLNVYMGTRYDGYGNVPVSADYLYMAVPPWGDWKHYHNNNEIVNTLLYLNVTYPSIVDVFSIGKSWQNRDIYCIRLTNESNTHPKPKVFFVGYHHAREPISAELPLYFAVEAATNFGTNETITHMLNYSEIYIVPMLNVDAFEAFKQNEWQRKNVHPYDEDNDALLDEDPPDDEDGDGYIENLFFWNGTHYWFIRWEGIDDDGDGLLNEDWVGGVDLNRNYGYQWNATVQSGSPYPWAEDYRGLAPFSEPETQAIRDLALSHNFKYAISFHSGTEVIGYPWGYTTDPTPDDATFKEIAANLSALVGAPYGQNSGLYTASGMWDDWMYGNRSTFALTCEIYTNNSAWQYEPGPEPDTWWEKGVFQFFNPDPNQIETVIQRWLPVFTYTTNRAITEAYDTATTNITPQKTVVGQGYSMHINVTAANKGEFTETFSVTLYANTTIIETRELTLTNRSSTTIAFTWDTSGFAKGNYTISAYAWPVPGETSTTDNLCVNGWVFVGSIGDINADGIVDIEDIYRVALAYGSRPGDPTYNPNLDINYDTIIDIEDIYTTALHYGETDP